MEKKVVNDYVYTGLLFPIKLNNVEMVLYDGEWHPKIDVIKLTDTVINQLATNKNKLTGNQIKFIRSYFNMSLRKFADEVVNESHTAVRKWESFANEPTNMDFNIEQTIRLYICEKTNTDKEFYKRYLDIRELAKIGLIKEANPLYNFA